MNSKWTVGCACFLFLTSGAAFAQVVFPSSMSRLPSGGQSLSGGGMASNGSRGLRDEETGHPLADSLREGVSDGMAESVRNGGGVLADSIHGGANVTSDSGQDAVDSLHIGLDESGGSALSALLYEPGDQQIRKGIKYGGYALGYFVRHGSARLSYVITDLGDALASGTSGNTGFSMPSRGLPASSPGF